MKQKCTNKSSRPTEEIMTIFLSLATFCSAVSAVSKWGLVDNFMCFVFKTSVISNNCPWFTSLFYRFLFHFEISVSVTSLPAFSPPSLVWTTESAAAFHHIFMILVFSSFLFFIYICFQVFSSCMTFSHFHGLWLLPGPHLFVCHVASLPCMTLAFSYSFVFETLFCFPASYVSVSSCKCEKLLLEI